MLKGSLMWDILSQTNLASGALGVISGYVTRAQQNRHELNKLQMELLAKKHVENLKDQQDARHTSNPALAVMRIILISVVGLVILFMFMVPGFYHWPVSVETPHQTGWLTRLFHGPTHYVWHTFQGIVIPDQFWELVFYICGFLFGGRR